MKSNTTSPTPHNGRLAAQLAPLVLLLALVCGLILVPPQYASQGVKPAAKQPSLPLLTSVDQIHKLTTGEAKRAYPIHLTAVVTYYDPRWHFGFVQDSTAGIFVAANNEKPFTLKAGEPVEVEGVSGPGEFAPVINGARFAVKGLSTPPAPPPLSLEQLFSGREDSNWVQAEGIVQSVTRDGDHAVFGIVFGPYQFRALVSGFTDGPLPTQLIDSKVRIAGVCGSLFNEKRQLEGIQMLVPGIDDVRVTEPGPPDPYLIPVRPINTLLQFSPGENVGHRVRVKGVVTLSRPGGDFFITDGTGGLNVQTQQTGSLRPGDRVDALGFATAGEYMPVLKNAAFKTLGGGVDTPAARMTAEEALTGAYHSQLVQTEALLLDRVVSPTDEVLTLQTGKTIFNAYIEDVHGVDVLPSVRNGSLVRVTGICLVQTDQSRVTTGARLIIQSFRLIARSPRDVFVVKNAPWWTLKHTLWVGAVHSRNSCGSGLGSLA
ncbi:MAG TPA: hypothetical protein VJX67_09490 [Blastocatellia bacterium]|nr:hypothetical protein [Blastocatellia bacterium]